MDIFTAELIGTAILILLGDGVVAGVLLHKSKAQNAGWIVITLAWGMAVFIGDLRGRPVQRCAAQPGGDDRLRAVDITPWADVPKYIAGQFVGAFIGAILVYLAYLPHWRRDGGPRAEARRLLDRRRRSATTAAEPDHRDHRHVRARLRRARDRRALRGGSHGRVGQAALATAFGTSFVPLPVGLLVLGIGLSLGGPTGYAINPARDLGPRIIHAILPIPGKGDSDWGYSWIPVVGPHHRRVPRRSGLRGALRTWRGQPRSAGCPERAVGW